MEKQKNYTNGQRVSPLDVKRYFLLADAGKGLEFKGSNKLEKIAEMKKEIWELDEREVNKRIGRERAEEYDNLEWYADYVGLNKVSPYKGAQGLDERLTSDNIEETARNIRGYENGELNLDYEDDSQEKERKEKLDEFSDKRKSIRENLDVVYENFPLILVPGDDDNEVKCKVDDGNSRVIAYSDAGLEAAPSFYGVKSDSKFYSLAA